MEKRVLYYDSHYANKKMLDIFMEEGYKVDFTSDIAEALRLLKSNDYGAAIVDVSPAFETGVSLFDRLHEVSEEVGGLLRTIQDKNIPMIHTSTSRYQRQLVEDHIEKPYDPMALVDRVNERFVD